MPKSSPDYSLRINLSKEAIDYSTFYTIFVTPTSYIMSRLLNAIYEVRISIYN